MWLTRFSAVEDRNMLTQTTKMMNFKTNWKPLRDVTPFIIGILKCLECTKIRNQTNFISSNQLEGLQKFSQQLVLYMDLVNS